MKYIRRFNEALINIKVDSTVEKILKELENHEDVEVQNLSKTLLDKLDFESISSGGNMTKVANLIKSNIDVEYPIEVIKMFVSAFATLNDGSSEIKFKF